MRIEKMKEDIYKLRFKKRSYSLEIEVQNVDPVLLVGPKAHGEMSLDVLESINATGTLTLKKGNKTIVQTYSSHIGFEQMYFKE